MQLPPYVYFSIYLLQPLYPISFPEAVKYTQITVLV